MFGDVCYNIGLLDKLANVFLDQTNSYNQLVMSSRGSIGRFIAAIHSLILRVMMIWGFG